MSDLSHSSDIDEEELEDCVPLLEGKKGTIKKFFEDRGFGFITPDDGGSDVFVHRKVLGETGGVAYLTPGDRVSFDMDWDAAKGKYYASYIVGPIKYREAVDSSLVDGRSTHFKDEADSDISDSGRPPDGGGELPAVPTFPILISEAEAEQKAQEIVAQCRQAVGDGLSAEAFLEWVNTSLLA